MQDKKHNCLNADDFIQAQVTLQTVWLAKACDWLII